MLETRIACQATSANTSETETRVPTRLSLEPTSRVSSAWLYVGNSGSHGCPIPSLSAMTVPAGTDPIWPIPPDSGSRLCVDFSRQGLQSQPGKRRVVKNLGR